MSRTNTESLRERYKKLILILTIIYFGVLFYLVFFIPSRINFLGWQKAVNLIPFANIVHTIELIKNLKSLFLFLFNFIGNICIFIPISFILCWYYPSLGKGLIIIFGVLLSLFIEIMQHLFGLGIADVDDVILNTAGVCIGLFLVSKFSIVSST